MPNIAPREYELLQGDPFWLQEHGSRSISENSVTLRNALLYQDQSRSSHDLERSSSSHVTRVRAIVLAKSLVSTGAALLLIHTSAPPVNAGLFEDSSLATNIADYAHTPPIRSIPQPARLVTSPGQVVEPQGGTHERKILTLSQAVELAKKAGDEARELRKAARLAEAKFHGPLDEDDAESGE